jgi:hypothetical protein
MANAKGTQHAAPDTKQPLLNSNRAGHAGFWRLDSGGLRPPTPAAFKTHAAKQ